MGQRIQKWARKPRWIMLRKTSEKLPIHHTNLVIFKCKLLGFQGTPTDADWMDGSIAPIAASATSISCSTVPTLVPIAPITMPFRRTGWEAVMTPLKAGQGAVGRLLSAALSYSGNYFTCSLPCLLNARCRTTSRQRSC